MLMGHLTQENLLKWGDECFVSVESSTKAKCETDVKCCMLLASELFCHYYQQKQWELSRQKIIYPFPALEDDFEINWPGMFWSCCWEKRWASQRYSFHPTASGYFPCSRVHQKECVFELHCCSGHPTFTGIKELLWIFIRIMKVGTSNRKGRNQVRGEKQDSWELFQSSVA